MRLTTWNCQMGFARKASALFLGNPDIAVIQECSRKDAESIYAEQYSGLWFGSNPTKGLAVFSSDAWTLRPFGAPKHEWVTAVEVTGPESFTLVAVWACAVKGNRRESYVGVIHKALEMHPEWFERGPVVMAGDFNSNSVFDRNRPVTNHSALVARLRAYGLVSAYHAHYKENQGQESTPTFHLYRKTDITFHLDYIFMPQAWLRRLKDFELGNYEEWGCLSDHCPLTIDVAGRSKLSRKT